MALEILSDNDFYQKHIRNNRIDPSRYMPQTDRLDVTTFDVVKAAFQKENALVSDLVEEKPVSTAVEEDFDPIAAIAGTKYEQYIDNFITARNGDEVLTIQKNIDREIQNRKILDEAGGWGMAAEMIAGVLDPVGIFMGGAVGKTAGRIGKGLVVNVGGKSYPIVSAVVGGAADVATTEAVLQSTQQTRTALESGAAVVGGAAIGGAIGSYLGRQANVSASLDDLMYNAVGQTQIPKNANKARFERNIEEYSKSTDLPGYEPTFAKFTDEGDAVRFKQMYENHLDTDTITYKNVDKRFAYDNEAFGSSSKYQVKGLGDVISTAAGKVTVAMTPGGRTSTSIFPTTRQASFAIAENTRQTAANKEFVAKAPAAESFIKARKRQLGSTVVNTITAGKVDFTRTLDEWNARYPDNMMNKADFDDAVTRYLREGDTEVAGQPVNPAVLKTAEAIRKVYDDITNEFVDLGVVSKDAIGERALGDLSYTGRYYNTNAVIKDAGEFKAIVKESVVAEAERSRQYARTQVDKFNEEFPTTPDELIRFVLGDVAPPKQVVKTRDVSGIDFGVEDTVATKAAGDELDDFASSLSDVNWGQKGDDSSIDLFIKDQNELDELLDGLDDITLGVKEELKDPKVVEKFTKEELEEIQDVINNSEGGLSFKMDDLKVLTNAVEKANSPRLQDKMIIMRTFQFYKAGLRDYSNADTSKLNTMYDKLVSTVQDMRRSEVSDDPRHPKALNTNAYSDLIIAKEDFMKRTDQSKAIQLMKMLTEIRSTANTYANKPISDKSVDGLVEYMYSNASGVGAFKKLPSMNFKDADEALVNSLFERVVGASSESMRKFLDNNPESIVRRHIDIAVPIIEVMKKERELLGIQAGKMENEAGEKLTGDFTFVYDRLTKQFNELNADLKLASITDKMVARPKATMDFKRSTAGGFNMSKLGPKIQKEFKDAFLDEMVKKKYLTVDEFGTYKATRRKGTKADQKLMDKIKAEVEAKREGYSREIDKIEGIRVNVSDTLSQNLIMDEVFNQFISKKIIDTAKKNGYDFENKAAEWKQQYEKDYTSDIKDLQAMVQRVKGEYRGSDPASIAMTGSRSVRKLTGAAYLGSTPVSALPDLAGIVAMNGYGRTFRVGLGKIINKMVKGGTLGADLKRIGIASEWTLAKNNSALVDAREGITTNFVEKNINKVSDIAMRATLMPIINDMTKMLNATIFQDTIVNTANKLAAGKKVKPADLRRLAEMGLGKDDLLKVAEQFKKYGDQSEGVAIANIDKWDDPLLAARTHAALTKHTDTAIITPGAGDMPLWTDNTEGGKLVSQFTSFLFSSLSRKVVQGLSSTNVKARDVDLQFFTSFPLALGLSALAVAARNELTGKETDWENEGTWYRIVDGTGYIPLMGIASRPLKAVGWDLEPGGTTNYTSAKSALGTIAPSTGIPLSIAAGGKELLEGNTLDAANEFSRAMPFQNNWLLRLFSMGWDTRKDMIDDVVPFVD